jgi:hypothetical protein
MLTHIDTLTRHTLFDHERSNIIKAIEDMFHNRHDLAIAKPRPKKDNNAKPHSITRLPVSILQQSERQMHYELLDIVPVREGIAVVKILQTPLDREGKRIEEATTSPLLVIAKSGDEWEMVGLPLPLHCLLSPATRA